MIYYSLLLAGTLVFSGGECRARDLDGHIVQSGRGPVFDLQRLASLLLQMSPSRSLQDMFYAGGIHRSFRDRRSHRNEIHRSPTMQSVTSTDLQTGTMFRSSFEVGGKTITLETGRIGRQASGAVVASTGDTMVYSTACYKRDVEETDFIPFKVDWLQRYSAAGKTSGAFHRTDSRGDNFEVLVARLIDRPLRPMIAEGWMHDTQIVTHVLSYDGIHTMEPLSICAASAAMAVSEIPMVKPIAGVEVGLVDGILVINPTMQEKEKSSLSLVMAGTKEGILMIEGEADFLPDEMMTEAIALGHAAIGDITDAISEFAAAAGKAKKLDTLQRSTSSLVEKLDEEFGAEMEEAFSISDKQERGKAVGVITDKARELFVGRNNEDDEVTLLDEEDGGALIIDDEDGKPPTYNEIDRASSTNSKSYSDMEVKKAMKKLSVRRLRERILRTGKRPDGRGVEDIRPISIEQSILPRPHGSSLFTRGETQSLATATLGGKSMRARYENLDEYSSKPYYLQYRFPPSSVGEVGRVNFLNRREVGHGNLAERALKQAIPDSNQFPYTIRAESLITESSGSSSMATVCSCCLAMLDAGVPLKSHVAGVAMGLIFGDAAEDEPVILTDILGLEDALGTMDFKVAGDDNGITAFQLDIKTEGLNLPTLKKALEQARRARLHILGLMRAAAPQTGSLKATIPKLLEFNISAITIGKVIGPQGKTVRMIKETFNLTEITVDEDDAYGYVQVESFSEECNEAAKAFILTLTSEAMLAIEADPPEVGMTYYDCKIMSIKPYGMFVEVTPGHEHLLHISKLSKGRIASIEESGLKEGDLIDITIEGEDAKGLMLIRAGLDEKPIEKPPGSYDPRLKGARPKSFPPEVGNTYRDCRIISVKDFGYFLEVTPGHTALLHVSEMVSSDLLDGSDYKEGDLLDVKVIGRNERGQLKLSRKGLLLEDRGSEDAVEELL